MTDVTVSTSDISTSVTPDLTVIDGMVTTTSQQVAEHFGKRHVDVIRAIKNIIAMLPVDYLRNFAQVLVEYVNGKGGTQEAFGYRITRDGFTLLAMGFTGKEALQWKLAYLSAFNAMEAELLSKAEQLPRTHYAVLPGQTLSAAQAATIRDMLTDACKALAKDLQAMFMTQGWSKLKTHFGVTYRKIPAHEFEEAVSLVTRHIQYFEGTKVLPAPATQPRLEHNTMALDVKTLTGMIHGGLIDQRAFMDIAYAVNQRQYMTACDNKRRGYGQEVADKIKTGLSDTDLHIITVAATMEAWLRTAPPAQIAATQ